MVAALRLRSARPWMPHGELMPEDEFYGVLQAWISSTSLARGGLSRGSRERLAAHPLVTPADLAELERGHPLTTIVAQCDIGGAVPLELRDGRIVGCCNRAHEEDMTLGADVLLENLACLATATMATRTLVHQLGIDPTSVDYVINSGEEAIGDRYQRGGGNLAKAVAERSGLLDATGSDIKAFCCGPNHALAIAAGLVQPASSRDHRRRWLLGREARDEIARSPGQGHANPRGRAGRLRRARRAGRRRQPDYPARRSRPTHGSGEVVPAGDPGKAGCRAVDQMGMRFTDVDRYATELHNPEVTEPTNTGNVPLNNYRMVAGMAVMRKQLALGGHAGVRPRAGHAGFSPTQGHVASAMPYLGHAVAGLKPLRQRRQPAKRTVPGEGKSLPWTHDAALGWTVVPAGTQPGERSRLDLPAGGSPRRE